MDPGTTLGLAIIPPLVAIFFEAVNPLRDRFVKSSVERDFKEYEDVFSAAAPPAAAPPTTALPAPAPPAPAPPAPAPPATAPRAAPPAFDELIEIASGSSKAAIEIAMLALTGVSVITSGFATLHEFEKPYWPTIFYVLLVMAVVLYLWKLLAGYTLFQIDDEKGWDLRLRFWWYSFNRKDYRRYCFNRSYSRVQILAFMIYVSNGLLIMFAFSVLGMPPSWQAFFKHYRVRLLVGLVSLACVALVFSYLSSPQTWQRRTAIKIATLIIIALGILELTTDPRLASMMASVSDPESGSTDRDSGSLTDPHGQGSQARPDDTETTLSAMQKSIEAIETRLDSAAATLSVIPKNVEAIKTQLETAGTALSLIPNTLSGIDEQVLDMRIAQPVDLSYLKGRDCFAVQQALHDLGTYKRRVDGMRWRN